MATLKDSTYNAPAALTITLASLASSVAGVGRQSTIVDNTSTKYNLIELSVNTKMGTSPTANGLVLIYLIRDNNDGTAIIDDSAGVSDAGLTVVNAPLAGILRNPDGTTGNVLKCNFILRDVGPKWGVAVVNSSGVALDATGGNHVISWAGITKDIS